MLLNERRRIGGTVECREIQASAEAYKRVQMGTDESQLKLQATTDG